MLRSIRPYPPPQLFSTNLDVSREWPLVPSKMPDTHTAPSLRLVQYTTGKIKENPDSTCKLFGCSGLGPHACTHAHYMHMHTYACWSSIIQIVEHRQKQLSYNCVCSFWISVLSFQVWSLYSAPTFILISVDQSVCLDRRAKTVAPLVWWPEAVWRHSRACLPAPSFDLSPPLRARILYSVYILLMFCRSMCTEAYNERNCRRDSPTHCLQGVKWFGQVASGGKANSDGTSSSWRLMTKGSWPFAITLLAVKKGSYDFRALTKTQKMYDILGFEMSKTRKVPS